MGEAVVVSFAAGLEEALLSVAGACAEVDVLEPMDAGAVVVSRVVGALVVMRTVVVVGV